MSEDQIQVLINKCVSVRKAAYAPYSRYKVGAVLLTKNGRYFTGCNFEVASFGAGVCAERVAIGNAIANGEIEFEAICICGDIETITPCGICRQAIAEFGHITVICCNRTGDKYKIYDSKELLPFEFNLQ